jgi:hypothetical protein
MARRPLPWLSNYRMKLDTLYTDRKMLQARILSRDEFLKTTRMQSSTLDMRVNKRELVFSLGCTRPAHTGEYLPLDCVAALLCSMVNHFGKVVMRDAAEMVLELWYEWLIGVAQAEREMDATPIHQTYFAVVIGTRFAAVGKMTKAIAKLNLFGPHESSYNMLPLQLVLRALRGNARLVGVDLPEFLTPKLGTPEFERFLESVREYQRLAGSKFKGKTAARRAKAPAE